jgi:hypothetical protein
VTRKQVAEHLASEIASRLTAVVPPGTSVQSQQGVLEAEAPGVSWGVASYLDQLIDQEGDLRTHIEAATWNALSVVQDYLSEVMKRPWPFVPANIPNVNSPFSQPFAKILNDTLWLGYGAIDSPTLLLPTIPLAGFEDSRFFDT